jgi:hypothetical protein
VCVTRADRKRKPGKTRLTPQASLTCTKCGKPYANPLTHVCTVKSDFRTRKAAQDRQRKRAKTAAERARQRTAARAKTAAARQRQRAAVKAAVERERQRRREAVRTAVARERQRATKAAQAKTAPRTRTASGGTGQRADTHDYRECFYASQPDRGRARHDCERFPCRIYREGHEHGYQDGHPAGYAKGYADGYAKGHHDGYAEGFPDGIAACPLPHGG